MTLDSQALAELKEKLLREKTRIEEEIVRIAKPIKDTAGFDTNFNEIGTDEDHVHFLIQSIPMYSPTKIARIVKSITAREILTIWP